MTKPIRPTIWPESIDRLAAAGAAVEVIAKIGKLHLPELGQDIDVLANCNTPTVTDFIKAELQARHDKADRYAADRAAHMRQVRSGAKVQKKQPASKGNPEPELPLDETKGSHGLTRAHKS